MRGRRHLREYGVIELAGLVAAGGQRQTFVSPSLQTHRDSVRRRENTKFKVTDNQVCRAPLAHIYPSAFAYLRASVCARRVT